MVIAHNAGVDRNFIEKRLPVFADLPWGCSFQQVNWAAGGIGSGSAFQGLINPIYVGPKKNSIASNIVLTIDPGKSRTIVAL